MRQANAGPNAGGASPQNPQMKIIKRKKRHVCSVQKQKWNAD